MTSRPPAAVARVAAVAPAVSLVIRGEIVPYVRVGRERWTDRARRYFASRDAIQLQARAQMALRNREMLPGQTPLRIVTTFERRRLWTCDADNLFKAISDALNGIVYPDDRWIAEIEISKRPDLLSGPDMCYVFVEVTK